MPPGGKSCQRSAEAIRLPIGLALAPVAHVPREPVENFVMSPILIELIGEIPSGTGHRSSWRTKQREPNGIVCAFVGAVLWAGENRCAIGSALVRQINPVMRGNLKLAI